VAVLAGVFLSANAARGAVLIQDVTSLEANANPVTGIGLVVGLAGTGDSEDLDVTRRIRTNLLAGYDPALTVGMTKGSKNTAIVLVSAVLPPFHAVGSKIDVHVASVGDASSLKGGRLVETPLTGPDRGLIYALGWGQLHIPEGVLETTADIRLGGTVIEALPSSISDLIENGRIKLILDPKYAYNISMANQVAHKINQDLNPPGVAFAERAGAESGFVKFAEVISASIVEVTIPPEVVKESRYADFIDGIRQLVITGQADLIKARVIVNDRTQTIVMTRDIEIAARVLHTGAFTFTPTPGTTTVHLTDILSSLKQMNATHSEIANAIYCLDRVGALPAEVVAE